MVSRNLGFWTKTCETRLVQESLNPDFPTYRRIMDRDDSRPLCSSVFRGLRQGPEECINVPVCLANLGMSRQLGYFVSGVFSYAKLGAVKAFACLKIAILART